MNTTFAEVKAGMSQRIPIIASEGESKPKQLAPPGSHPARCVQVIDLGTQSTPFGESHKIRISWELPTEKAVFDEKKGEQPFLLSKDYTLSLYEKANLRHDLEAWRGKSFTEDQLAGFDITTLLGVACLLTVIHKASSNGKTYANVSAVSGLPKGMTVPAQINPSIQYNIAEGRSDTFNAFPDWLKKKIEGSFVFAENGGAAQEDKDRDWDSVPF